MSTLERVWHAPDHWLATRAVPSERSLAVYRAVYAAFSIWYLSLERARLADAPGFDTDVPLLRVVPIASPPVLGVLESLLVAALVLLGFGWRTRAMTVVVLVLGTYVDALFTNLDHEHGTAILVFWIPLCMLVFDGWSTDAGDATATGRATRTLAPTVLLASLSIWFFSAGVWKIVLGDWMTNADEITNIVHKADLIAALHELPASPFSAFMADHPLSTVGIRVFVPLFELVFFVALFGVAWRRLMVGIALLFQALNAIVLSVTFAPLIIVYGVWVDWDRWVPAWRPPRSLGPLLAVVVGIGWNTTSIVRDAANLWGLVDHRTIFWPLIPVSVVMIATATAQLISGFRGRGRRG